MTLKQLKNDELLLKTKALVKEETRITQLVLQHLAEIEDRRLYLDRGYPSLFEFARIELGYSEASAWRRIDAMRLIKKQPEVAAKITNGTLNITVAAMAQSVIRKQKISDSKMQKELIEKLEGQSVREAEKTIRAQFPEMIPQERIKPLNAELSELRIVIDQETLNGWNELLGLLSHRNPELNHAQQLKHLIKVGKEKWEKEKFGRARPVWSTRSA